MIRLRLSRLLLVGLASLSFSFPTNPVGADERPNIVLILADDLGYETVGCYGGESYPTPRLDALARGGIRFDRAYAMPLCTNTRIQLMTGKYNLRNWNAFGILDPKEATFGKLLQSAGYKTCMAGKWQLTSYDPPDYPGAGERRNTGMLPGDAGFDSYSLWHTGHTEEKGSRYADPVIDENGKIRVDTQDKYGPDEWTDFINDFITDNQTEPFFVYYSMALPHNPMNPTPDSPEWTDPSQRHDDVTRYAADMITYTDKMVGKIIDHLEDLQLREKTLVLFYSDNGTNSRVRSRFRGETVGGEKGKGTELGCRVPMIASWPGTIAAGTESHALIDSVDFLPTLLDVAHAENDSAGDLDGISFVSLLDGTKKKTRDHVYIHQDPRPGWDKDQFGLIRVAIERRYKLYEDGRLFDLENDFLERHPIWPQSDSEEQRDARKRLEHVHVAYSDFRAFDPNVVPREDPNLPFAQHAFQDSNGIVSVAAEQIPFGRDEAWTVETHSPGYLGLGYLRTLKTQPGPESGVASILLSMKTAGEYSAAFRVRCDTVSEKAILLWVKPPAGDWQHVEMETTQETVGNWVWIEPNSLSSVRMEERNNEWLIAPASRNIKLDRCVFFRSEHRVQALDRTLAASPFHPWSRP